MRSVNYFHCLSYTQTKAQSLDEFALNMIVTLNQNIVLDTGFQMNRKKNW